ncbi:TetR/AcrR family transcriptional regulator [Streptomyces sp. B21-105]|uniref:TetR/AcrR family transcriptional regulator n=1 Tax=Streptomyces sp. B21-105 TaxID=3039417 RepID=UPI003FA7BE4A
MCAAGRGSRPSALPPMASPLSPLARGGMIPALANATTQRIQDRVNLSRGALSHHFASKTDLPVAATHHIADQRLELLRSAADGIEPGPHALAQVVSVIQSAMSGPPFLAALELLDQRPHRSTTACRTDPPGTATGPRPASDLRESHRTDGPGADPYGIRRAADLPAGHRDHRHSAQRRQPP